MGYIPTVVKVAAAAAALGELMDGGWPRLAGTAFDCRRSFPNGRPLLVE